MQSQHTILAEFGLSEREIDVYLLLQRLGECTVPRMVEQLSLSRASIYDALQSLKKMKFVEHRKEGHVALYRAAHPQQLARLIDQKQTQTGVLIEEMKETMRQLTATYNVAFGKPGVRFFEGQEQTKEALFDSLHAKETIYTFANSQIINAFAQEVNEEYMKERIRRNIHKNIIFADTPEARKMAQTINPQYTSLKFISAEKYPFTTPVEIYNDTLSYHVLHTTYPVAFLIYHKDIAQFHKSMFEFMWSVL